MNKELKILLTLGGDIKIISVNALYGARILNGRAVKYKTNEAKKMCAAIREELRALDLTDYKDWLRDTKQFSVTQTYILKTNSGRRDVGNMEKAISDEIVKYLKEDVGLDKFDDSKFSDLHLYKQIFPGAAHEYIVVSIKPSTYNMRFDQTTKPTNVCIHSSLDLKKFIKKLPKKTQTTTDPCDDATDSDLFVLESIQSPLEIVNSVYRRSESGFCYIGCLGFDPDPDLISTITLLSQGKSNIKIARIQDVTDLIDWFK